MKYFDNKKIKFGVVVFFLVLAGAGIYFLKFKFGQLSLGGADNFVPVAVDNQKNESVTVMDEVATIMESKSEPVQPAVVEPEKITSAVLDAETKVEIKTDELKPADELPSTGTERFVVALGADGIDQVAKDLAAQGFVADVDDFKKIFALAEAEAGGYKLSKKMNVAQIAAVLKQKPYMEWVVIPEGLRKEEVAAILGGALGWTRAQEDKWAAVDTQTKADNVEGVYFPDTYLIPVDEASLDVAKRLVAKFNEKFAVYLPEFSAQNIKWTTGLTLASIVQREAANAGQMPLVAGILWNRLEQGMALNVDATLQYARGDAGKGWWAPISVRDKQIDSPYNTYKNKGLPPHPICNPGIAAIEAVLKPEKTDCLYYLHDAGGAIHCAKTYEEHQANIEKYLKTAD
ncbi:MAG: endolytic transglycosylase MltG [Candidatus Paceibacterota bacterium]